MRSLIGSIACWLLGSAACSSPFSATGQPDAGQDAAGSGGMEDDAASSGGAGNDSGTEAGGPSPCTPAPVDTSSCDSASCAPTPLFTGQSRPGAIGADGSALYWITKTGSNYTLMKAPKEGGCPSPLAVDVVTGGIVRDLLVDDEAVYIGSTQLARSVVRVDKASGTTTAIVDANVCRSASPGVLALNAMFLFFACADNGGLIGKWDKTTPGALPMPLHDPAESLSFGGLAADSSTVYFNLDMGSLEAVPAAGGAPSTVSIADAFARIALFGSAVYGLSATQVLRIPIGGGTLDPMITSIQAPIDLRADTGGVFVIARGTGDGAGMLLGASADRLGQRTLATKLGRPAG
ncbi:MAG TPA: hypothetical protein VF881_05295, partial [Polyangiaceae bacterium]